MEGACTLADAVAGRRSNVALWPAQGSLRNRCWMCSRSCAARVRDAKLDEVLNTLSITVQLGLAGTTQGLLYVACGLGSARPMEDVWEALLKPY